MTHRPTPNRRVEVDEQATQEAKMDCLPAASASARFWLLDLDMIAAGTVEE